MDSFDKIFESPGALESYVLVNKQTGTAPKQPDGKVYGVYAKSTAQAWSYVMNRMRAKDMDMHEVVRKNQHIYTLMPLAEYVQKKQAQERRWKPQEQFKSIKRKEWQQDLFPPEQPN